MATRKTTKPASKPLTLADVDIVWTLTPFAGESLIPVLRFGGSQAISTYVRGLCDLLKGREVLDEDELVFVRESLSELASRLYVYEGDGQYKDAGAAARCEIVVRAQPSGKKEAA